MLLVIFNGFTGLSKKLFAMIKTAMQTQNSQ